MSSRGAIGEQQDCDTLIYFDIEFGLYMVMDRRAFNQGIMLQSRLCLVQIAAIYKADHKRRMDSQCFSSTTRPHSRRPATYDESSTHLVVALGTVLLHELTTRMVLRQRDYGSQYRYGMAIHHGFSYQAWGAQHAKRDGTPDIYPAGP